MPDPIELWQRVIDDPALLKRTAAINPKDVADLTRLRKDYDAPLIAVALELVAARRKLKPKFGDSADRMVADIAGAEQATSARVADHKATRYHEQLGLGAAVLDICCGIGGDAMSMGGSSLTVEAYDLDPLRVWMAQFNCKDNVAARQADAADLAPNGRAIHLDPARRSGGGRRLFKLDDYQPGPEVLGRLIDASGGAGIKLGPGVDLDAIPWPGEVEFISDGGRLVQAVLWTGPLARSVRTATLLRDKHPASTIGGEPAMIPLGEAERYIFTVDPAIERAGLIGNLANDLGVHAVHPKLGLLTADGPIDSPWLTGFEVIEQLPWRPKKVKQWLSAHDAGIVEVKTRGKAVDPDPVARQLRGKGKQPYTVFIHRWDQQKLAMICARVV